ncbi:MAG: cupin domain-containing protein [Marinobacter sp.]|uniref:cupin domain-containing protein n=1 Tax=Marinobacter sp. TaxID=50741 RepID=UPI00396DE6A2
MSQVKDIVDVTTTGISAETYLPDAEKILSGKPKQNVWNSFSSSDEKFHVGIWDAQAGEWAISYSEEEFCLILEGESVISDKDGHQKTVKAGDQFVIPAGFEGTWSVPSYCKKIYVIYEA